MSTELTLFPNHTSKRQLQQHLRSLGYIPSKHLWDWPAGAAHYHWFEAEAFKSTDGVEATIYPVAEEDRARFAAGPWALHTRTRASASRFDIAHQNETIRTARRAFGGSFYNDWAGKNRYITLSEDPRTPAGRGIFLSYEWVLQNLQAVQFSLPQQLDHPTDGENEIANLVRRSDPARVLFNALVPFAVAAIEHFFSQTFIILLRFDADAQRRLVQQQKKVELREVLAVASGSKRVEELVAGWYSFQNVQSIHNAFSEWFGIDVWNLLRRRKKIGRRVDFLERRLNHLIEFRHGVVHRFELDFGLDRDRIYELLDTARILIELFVNHLEQERGILIREPT